MGRAGRGLVRKSKGLARESKGLGYCRQRFSLLCACEMGELVAPVAYVSIRQHTSAYVSICEQLSAYGLNAGAPRRIQRNDTYLLTCADAC